MTVMYMYIVGVFAALGLILWTKRAEVSAWLRRRFGGGED